MAPIFPDINTPPAPIPISYPTPQSLLRSVQRYLGPNGEVWIKGSHREDGGFVDVSGALTDARMQALHSIPATAPTGPIWSAFFLAFGCLYLAINQGETQYERISDWNDAPDTKWRTVKKALKEAIKLSERYEPSAPLVTQDDARSTEAG